MKDDKNIYVPSEATILDVRDLGPDVRLYSLKTPAPVNHRPGQFFMVSVFGRGEIPISVNSTMDEPLMLAIRRVGRVTGAIHKLRAGDTIGLRGPYGNGFSLDAAKGRDVIIMAGGLGIVPLRPLIREILKQRAEFREVWLIYGSRTPDALLFLDEAREWEGQGLRVIHTVDCVVGDWGGCVGVVTSQLDSVQADFHEAAAFVCGPPVMIDLSMSDLENRGVPRERIVTTLEAHMKCGVGKCGHCYMGPRYICTDGPVFTQEQIRGITQP